MKETIGRNSLLAFVVLLVYLSTNTISFAGPIDNYIAIAPLSRANVGVTIKEWTDWASKVQGGRVSLRWDSRGNNYHVLYATTQGVRTETEAFGFLNDGHYAILNEYISSKGQMTHKQIEWLYNQMFIPIALEKRNGRR